MRERGLKQKAPSRINAGQGVAPHAGAWIETHPACFSLNMTMSLPMRERGLKHIITQDEVPAAMRRSPCGSVD